MDINRKEFMKSVVAFIAFFAIMYVGGYYGCQVLKNLRTMEIKYPETARENVVDNYHGVEIADPYRWLENDTSQATAQWVEAQNKVTHKYLDAIPFRDQLRDRLNAVTGYAVETMPSKKNGKYYKN